MCVSLCVSVSQKTKLKNLKFARKATKEFSNFICSFQRGEHERVRLACGSTVIARECLMLLVAKLIGSKIACYVFLK